MHILKYFILVSIFFLISNIYGQENLIIEKEISYNKSVNPDFASQNLIEFENSVYHEEFGSIPVLKIQIPIEKMIDSIEINLFDSKSFSKSYFPKPELIENLKKYHYEIQSSRGKKFITIFYNPFTISQEGNVLAYTQLKLLVTLYSNKNSKRDEKASAKWAANSVLDNGDWYKIKLSKSGVYKITGTQLNAMGISLASLSINDIRLYGNGGGMYPESNSGFFLDDLTENSIMIFDNNNNGIFESNDYFLFYGKGPNIWKYDNGLQRFIHSQHLYDNYAYYFITIKSGNAKRIQNFPQSTSIASTIINQFTDYQYYDKDSLNLIKSGKQWFGNEYNIILSHNYSFNFPGIISTEPVKVKISVAARSTTASTMNILANGNSHSILIPAVSGVYNSDYAAASVYDFTLNSSSSQININTTYSKSTSTSIGWMDYIEINAERELSMIGDQLSFRNPQSVGSGNISKFELANSTSNIQIWDISNPWHPLNLDYTLNSGYLSFVQATDSLREFIAHKGSYLTPAFVEKIANQNLHASPNVDYVICYNKKFENQVMELADYHRNINKLKVLTVDQKLLFNEFSSGASDIAALRNFMKMLYDRAIDNGETPPKYLLLFGDASYDYKNRVQNNTNYILTYESVPSLGPTNSYSSDDFFGLLDDNEGANCGGALDLGIGRFPVSSTTEAANLVDKVKRYQQTHAQPAGNANGFNATSIPNMADWRNIVSFIGDDQDNNVHVSQSDYMAEYVRNRYPVYNIDKLYLDAYVQQTLPGGQRYPDAKRDLNLRVSKGALILNYTGHGGEIGLAHESLLEINDILSWANKDNMPLFITATCEFSRYDDPSRVSAGEYAYLQPNGGMIALLTTSRLTFSGTNFTLNKYIFQSIFEETNGKYPTMGDIIRISKVNSGSISNNRNFVLLGDPALKLAYPEYEVKTLKINGVPLSQFNDTIKALSMVTISGQVEAAGVILSQFNGYVYPTIFDKAQTYTTLGNDFDSYPLNFQLQKNVIYKGKASVTNGKFSFNFIVPQDINYAIGLGKISYYAENGMIDANGYFDSILMGGNSNNNISDNDGPEIQLFMNDTLFVNGGLTNENPVFLAFLSDSNGINTTGNGIGHDITLTLDDISSKSISLNNFYQTKVNSYQSGYVVYPLSSLSDGHHNITLKAWDVLNNSNTANIEFVVATSEETMISSIMNFPNPFVDFTSFVFEHNMAGNKMDIQIEIFDIMGNKVRVLSTSVIDPGFKISSEDLKWSGTGENGQKLQSGVYNYRVIATTDAGQKTSLGGKLVLLN